MKRIRIHEFGGPEVLKLEDADETDRKYDYAHRADAPLRCDTIRAKRGGESWCGGCPFWGHIPSPIQLGYVPGYHYEPASRAAQNQEPTS